MMLQKNWRHFGHSLQADSDILQPSYGGETKYGIKICNGWLCIIYYQYSVIMVRVNVRGMSDPKLSFYIQSGFGLWSNQRFRCLYSIMIIPIYLFVQAT